jgi:hypothetical protein
LRSIPIGIAISAGSISILTSYAQDATIGLFTANNSTKVPMALLGYAGIA